MYLQHCKAVGGEDKDSDHGDHNAIYRYISFGFFVFFLSLLMKVCNASFIRQCKHASDMESHASTLFGKVAIAEI